MATLTMTRERTAIYRIAVTEDGAALDLAGKSLVFSAKESLSDESILILKSSPSSGIAIESPSTAGTALLKIDPADTEPLSDIQSHTLLFDVELINGSDRYGITSGTLKVLGNVGA